MIFCRAGLSSTGLGDAAAVAHGFWLSMIIGAGLLVVAACVAWFGVGPRPEVSDPAAADRLALHRQLQCPVSAPSLHPGEPAATPSTSTGG